jgi:3-methyladenine DNA glycosylase/8-oxoguanine DNA glycosylase
MPVLKISTPSAFSFKRTLYSHGWSQLLPFELEPSELKLLTVLDLGEPDSLTVQMTYKEGNIAVRTDEPVSARLRPALFSRISHIFRLDEDFTLFYRSLSIDPGFKWVKKEGAGRLIRSPTVFEDLVKTICTTNCSWALTDKMVRGLVNYLGKKSKDGRAAFPSPQTMAAESEKFYRDEIRAGYRSSYLLELAEKQATGVIDVESWAGSELPTSELKREIKKIKGVGDYAAENLLKLLGRYDGLALDSWIRARFAAIHNGGRTATDQKILRHYSRFKDYQGLALWCDMTADWI